MTNGTCLQSVFCIHTVVYCTSNSYIVTLFVQIDGSVADMKSFVDCWTTKVLIYLASQLVSYTYSSCVTKDDDMATWLL